MKQPDNYNFEELYKFKVKPFCFIYSMFYRDEFENDIQFRFIPIRVNVTSTRGYFGRYYTLSLTILNFTLGVSIGEGLK
jgi:hypothetical protein